jgi:hypothetical protein
MVTGCKDNVAPILPNNSQTINKLIYYRGSMMRNDSIIVDSSTIHYIGRIYKQSTGTIHFDTTYVDEEYSNSLLSSVSSEILWNTQGNLPDTNNTYSEKIVFLLTMRNNNYEERTIKFYQKIPEIDSLIKQFEQLSLKLFN